MRHLVRSICIGVLASLMCASAAFAQEEVAATFTPDDLDQLVGPIALYPDPLVAEIMTASTFPDQIVLADRYVSQGMSVDDLGQQGLDASVVDLAHYPTLLKWLDDNLAWTTQLGQAFTAQQQDVMDAVQRMRARAQGIGNLQSTPQETVVNDGDDIEIEPANPDEVYLPEYDPSSIYYTPGIYCSFGVALPVGGWLNQDWDWHNHHVIVWDHNHPRPHDWWTRPARDRHSAPGAHVWQSPTAVGGRYNGYRGYPEAVGPVHREPQGRNFRTTPVIPDSHAVIPRSSVVRMPERQGPRGAEPPPDRSFRGATPPADRSFGGAAPPPERSFSAPAAPPEHNFGGMFGGGESPRQTEAFSERGAESRGVSTPASGGFHGGGGGGGGGGFHGGGGGGGHGGGGRGH